MMQDVARIAMWSGPRNISTAMMRSFENRADAVVWDEPFYAHYLAETGLDHAMADEIIAAYENDWRKVADKAVGPVPGGGAVFYQKHMTHHLLPHMAMDWLDGLMNAFLIRDPARVLASYIEKRAQVTLEDLGLPQQQRLFEWTHERTGKVPLVLESDDVLANPEGMLRALCRRTGIAFDSAMLSWPVGRRGQRWSVGGTLVWRRGKIHWVRGFASCRQSRAGSSARALGIGPTLL